VTHAALEHCRILSNVSLFDETLQPSTNGVNAEEAIANTLRNMGIHDFVKYVEMLIRIKNLLRWIRPK